MLFSFEMACDLTITLLLLAGTAASFSFAVCATVVFLGLVDYVNQDLQIETANFGKCRLPHMQASLQQHAV